MCSDGSRRQRFPVVSAHMQLSDSPASFDLGCVHHSPSAYLGIDALLHDVTSASIELAYLGVLLSALRIAVVSRGEVGASQVAGSSSFARATAKHSARFVSTRPMTSTTDAAFAVIPTARHLERAQFRSHLAAARPLAHLRIAVEERLHPRRRKARYRPAGLGIGRAGFAPAGRQSEFQFGFRTSLPSRPAFHPGRTGRLRHPDSAPRHCPDSAL